MRQRGEGSEWQRSRENMRPRKPRGAERHQELQSGSRVRKSVTETGRDTEAAAGLDRPRQTQEQRGRESEG